MNAYILLIISIGCAVIYNLLMHGFGNKGLRGIGDVLFFNGLMAFIWVLFFIPMRAGSAIPIGGILWGLVYGVILSMFFLCKMQAMATGPVSVTSFAGCSSMLVSTLFAVVVYGDKFSAINAVGAVLLLGTLYLVVAPKSGQAQKSWKYWCIGFFICSAATGILIKVFRLSPQGEDIDGMMLVGALTAGCLLTALAAFFTKREYGTFPRVPKNALLFLILCGICGFAYNRLNFYIGGVLPGPLFFQVFNGAVLLLASLLAALIFREKTTKQQKAGLLLGVAALVLVSM